MTGICLAASRVRKACRDCGEPIVLLCLLPSQRWVAFEADPRVTNRRREHGRMVADVDLGERHRCPAEIVDDTD